MIHGVRKPIVYLITEGEARNTNSAETVDNILEIVRIAVDEQVSIIQIREKQLSARSLFELAKSAADITRGSATRLLINERADIALAAQADGVHLPANSISAEIIRANFPPEFIIGVSAHSHEAVVKAAKAGADFVVFGPVFTTPGKGKPRGLDELHRVCGLLPSFPVIAIGGIDGTRTQSVLDAGAAGFAAIRYLNNPENLRKIATQAFNEQIRNRKNQIQNPDDLPDDRRA